MTDTSAPEPSAAAAAVFLTEAISHALHQISNAELHLGALTAAGVPYDGRAGDDIESHLADAARSLRAAAALHRVLGGGS